jgi:hypothetical protein
VKTSALRECLWLVKNHVPFDIAFKLTPRERASWCIIMSEHDGGKFNWNTMSFEDFKK